MQSKGYLLKYRRRAGGFTLAEILVTLLILGFVGVLGVPMLGQHRMKNLIDFSKKHGTVECFWGNNGILYRYEADNVSNPDGELTALSGDTCTFTAPSADMFEIQAVGAGGNGAVGMTGEPTYEATNVTQSGTIDVSKYHYDINKAPDWVKEYWDMAWSDKANWINFTMTSHLQKAGDGACMYSYNPPSDARSRAACEDNNCNNVPSGDSCSGCRLAHAADGGDSGNGIKVTGKLMLPYDEDATVYYNGGLWLYPGYYGGSSASSYSTLHAAYSRDYVRMFATSSSRGGDGSVNKNNNGYVVTNGTNGVDASAPTIYNADDWIEITSTQTLHNARTGGKGAISAYTCNDDLTGEKPVAATISYSTTSIPYSGGALAVNANYGVAGNSGGTNIKFLEKLPAGTQLELKPAKSYSSGSSVVKIIRDEAATIFMTAASGAEGWGGTAVLEVKEEGDLPFPVEDKTVFTAKDSEFSVTSGSGYKSWLAENGLTPGRSGTGAYPLILNVAVDTSYYINGVEVGDGAQLNAVSEGEAECFDGSAIEGSEGGIRYCGYSTRTGSPGAIVISW